MRILYIGIDFYGYMAEIADAFRRQGHAVDAHPIEPRGFWAKTAKRFFPGAYARWLAGYHERLVEGTTGIRYDAVVFIQVHHLAPATLARLRELQPAARFILYNWDSLRVHDYRPWIAQFDRVATFDPDDAAAIGVEYLPLFAVPRFLAVDHGRPKDFDIYFVGSIVTMERFAALEKLHAFCNGHGIRLKMHLWCSPPIRLKLWARRKYLPGLTLRSLDFAGIIDLMERSGAVYDFANHAQSGYTMRFIENMCAGMKIVTEKARVLKEGFYRPDRFLVHDPDDLSAMPAFLSQPVTSQLDARAFSIDSWAATLLRP